MTEDRKTFTVPDGFVAVRDEEGRATGEVVPEGVRWRPIDDSDSLVRYVTRYGGSCRDCADRDGICDNGMPCDLDNQRKAIRHVIAAINYGYANGFLFPSAAPSAISSSPLPPAGREEALVKARDFLQRTHPNSCAFAIDKINEALASPPALVGEPVTIQLPVAWEYELATVKRWDGTYDKWVKHLTDYMPHVPEGSIRNLRGLVYAAPVSPAPSGLEAIKLLIRKMRATGSWDVRTLDRVLENLGTIKSSASVERANPFAEERIVYEHKFCGEARGCVGADNCQICGKWETDHAEWERTPYSERPLPPPSETQRCTICGFIIDTRYEVEKPTANFSTAGRAKAPAPSGPYQWIHDLASGVASPAPSEEMVKALLRKVRPFVNLNLAPDDLVIQIDAALSGKGPAPSISDLRHDPAVEELAKQIYAAMPYDEPIGTKPAWVEHGNSLKQDEARREARARLSSDPRP